MVQPRVISLLLALVTILVYLPVGQHGFIVFDDPDYVTANPHVTGGLSVESIAWAFTSFYADNWHPLTWISHQLDVQLFGLNPGAHHFVNAILHALNAALVFLLFDRLTGRRGIATLIAALFAWHPLRVESVAWIAERKDVLSAFLGLLSLWFYRDYLDSNRRSRLGLVLVCFGCGLMAKPMLVTLPFVLLLLDWHWLNAKERQVENDYWTRKLLEKWPLFLLSMIASVLTLLAQRQQAVVSLEAVPLELRLQNALSSYVQYLAKTIWPQDLAIVYPLRATIPSATVVTATLLLVGISILCWSKRRSKPELLTGWLWYLGMLVPVIGIVQVGGQAMADRYTYLPQIGILWAAVSGMSSTALLQRLGRTTLTALGVTISAASLYGTHHQITHWRSSEILFNHAVAVTADNPIALVNLGIALEQEGKIDLARQRYEQAIISDPQRVQAHNNLANLLAGAGDYTGAEKHYREALRLNPNAALAHQNFAMTLGQLGRITAAQEHLTIAEQLRPNSPQPAYLRGKLALNEGQSSEAVDQFKSALAKDANHLSSLVWLARVKASDRNDFVRDGAGALAAAERANHLTGGEDIFVLDTLAMANAEAGRWSEAVIIIDAALQKTPVGETSLRNELIMRKRLYELRQTYREDFIKGRAAREPRP